MCVTTGDLDAAEASAYMPPGEEGTDEDTIIISTIAAMTTETLTGNTSSTFFEEEDNQLEFILMVLIPSILLALLLLSVVLIIIKYKRKKAKQGKYFGCSQVQTIASYVNEQSIKQSTFSASPQCLLAKDLRVFYRHVSIILTPAQNWRWGKRSN